METLVVVLGAGASIKAGVPSTSCLTRVCRDALPTFRSDGMTWTRGKLLPPSLTDSDDFALTLDKELTRYFKAANSPRSYTFEDLLGLIEELLGYVFGKPLVTSVTHILPPDSILKNNLMLLSSLQNLLEAIHSSVGVASSSPVVQNSFAAAQIRRILEALSKRYRLVVINFNYDNIADDANVEWHDGFVDSYENALLFSPRAWENQIDNKDAHLLVHLHGSVRFGLKPTSALSVHGRFDEPAKYETYAEAARTTTRSGSSTTVDGKVYPASFIISGTNKGPKLGYNLRPYGYYQRALVELVPHASRLLVMGYGWGDDHVNLFLKELVSLSGDLKSAVVGHRSGTEVNKNTPQNRYLMRLAGGSAWSRLENWAYCPVVEPPTQTLWSDGHFMLLPCGFDLSIADEVALLNHLN